MNAGQAQRVSGPNDDSVAKCVKFFKTLINLTQQNRKKYSEDAVDTVKNLIEGLVSGTIVPEQFTTSIQEVLKSQTQPQLLPFIHNTLPALRIALLTGQQSIDGIRYTGHASNEAIQNHQLRPDVEPTTIEKNEEKYQPGAFGNMPMEVDEVPPQKTTLPPTSAMLNLSKSMPFTTLDSRSLLVRLAEQVPECEGIDQEVVAKISEIAEGHLRELLIQLSEIAGHRLEPLKMNPMYKQISDPRKQLKVIDEFEKQAFLRQELVEKEALLKGSKAKTKETSQKAKEIKNANQEEKLNREANEAAIAALGGMRSAKIWNRYDPMKAPIGNGMIAQNIRPRTRRINIRDLQCALDCKKIPGDAVIKARIAYGLFRLPDNENHLPETI